MPRSAPLLGSDRRRLVAEGAVDLLAEEGAHGLTHRRLDRKLGLPEGSTSNVFSSRDELLAGALAALVDIDLGAMGLDAPPEVRTPRQAAAVFGDVVSGWLAPAARTRLVARYELLLESSRRPALQEVFLAYRVQFASLAEWLAEAAGCDDPGRRGAELVAWADGVLLDHVAGPGSELDRDAIVDAVRRLLT